MILCLSNRGQLIIVRCMALPFVCMRSQPHFKYRFRAYCPCLLSLRFVEDLFDLPKVLSRVGTPFNYYYYLLCFQTIFLYLQSLGRLLQARRPIRLSEVQSISVLLFFFWVMRLVVGDDFSLKRYGVFF